MFLALESFYVADNNLSFEEIGEKIKNVSFPVVVTNEKLVVVARNSKASYKLLKLRMGSNLGRFLSEVDRKVVCEMNSGDSESVGVKAGDGAFAYVLRYDRYYIFCFKAITALLNRKLSEIDESYRHSIAVTFSNKFKDVDGRNARSAKKGLRHHSQITKCFALLAQFGANSKTVLKASDAVSFFVRTSQSLIPEIKITNTSLCDDDLALECNLEDFFIFLSTVVSICIRGSSCKNIYLHNAVCFDHFGVTVSCDSEFSDEISDLVCEVNYEEKAFDFEKDYLLDAMLLKCIAAFNGWDFKIRKDLIERGRIQFSIFIPPCRKHNRLELKSPRLSEDELEYYRFIIERELFLGVED